MTYAVVMWEDEPYRLWKVQHREGERPFQHDWEECRQALNIKDGKRMWDLPQITSLLKGRGWEIEDAGEWVVVEENYP